MIGSALAQRGSLIRLGIPIGVIFVCAVLLGWNAGDTPIPPPPPLAPTPWSLPQPKPDDTARDLAVITAGRPWNRGLDSPAGAATPPAAASAPSWRLAGIVERNNHSFALIASGPDAAAKLDYLSVGDPLPDGSVLVEIAPAAAISEGGKSSSTGRHVYRLFGEKQ
jgi:hypothetical protein